MATRTLPLLLLEINSSTTTPLKFPRAVKHVNMDTHQQRQTAQITCTLWALHHANNHRVKRKHLNEDQLLEPQSNVKLMNHP
jgi:hypothetical protein